MVSWPFRVKKEISHLDQFKQLTGIELDQLDPNTVVLRSLPHYLKDFEYQKVIEHLLGLNSLPLNKNDYFESLKMISSVFNQTPDFLRNIILRLTNDEIAQCSFFKMIDGSLLDKIFKK
jgi:hypothetical protein